LRSAVLAKCSAFLNAWRRRPAITAKRALICGIGGQDGAYLAQLLLDRGYTVFGTSRDASTGTFANLRRLDILDRVELLSMAPNDFRSVMQAVQSSAPGEIYSLAGQSSVGLSFDLPAETVESIVSGTLNLLEVMRMSARDARFYHAGSSECFGDLEGRPATEATPFRPYSPYGVAKASAHMLVGAYRKAYGLFACNGILFNHESPLRPIRFVTRKVTAAAARIAAGADERLVLGNIDICRDWGWAPEYVEAMWRMLQTDEPGDFVVATGQTHRLEDFVSAAFASVDLDWRDHVTIDSAIARPADIGWNGAIPAKAEKLLGWRATVEMPEIARRMVAAEPGLV
jgi:GDPmannose 4,6-dehydratase